MLHNLTEAQEEPLLQVIDFLQQSFAMIHYESLSMALVKREFLKQGKTTRLGPAALSHKA